MSEITISVEMAETIINMFFPLIAILGAITIGFALIRGIRYILTGTYTSSEYQDDRDRESQYPAIYATEEWEDPNIQNNNNEPERCRYCGKRYDGEETQCHSCGANR